MSIAFLVIIALAIAVGFFGGLGKVLTIVSKGIFGKIMTIVICYCVFGLVLDISSVKETLNDFVSSLKYNPNFFKDILLFLRVEMIAFVIGLYFFVRISLKLLARLVDICMSSDNKVLMIINKTLGIIFAVFFVFLFTLIVFQVTYWISGPSGAIYEAVKGSFLGLDYLYLNNPLQSIIHHFIR